MEPSGVDKVVKATIVLHNYNVAPEGLREARHLGGNHAATDVMKIRDLFANYFQSENGRVPWQHEIVTGLN